MSKIEQYNPMNEIGYESLANVLLRAYEQAARGKGKERHSVGEPFTEQVIMDGARRFGVGSLLFQAFKKSEESQRLPTDRGVNELLGAIVYLSAAVIERERLAFITSPPAEKQMADDMSRGTVFPGGGVWLCDRWVPWEPTALHTFPMLPEGARIRVRLRDGKESQEGQGFDPVDYDWSRADTPRDTDLVAYMLLKPVEEPTWVAWSPTRSNRLRPAIDGKALVRIRRRDGQETPEGIGLTARTLEWGHAGEALDIVAYMLLK